MNKILCKLACCMALAVAAATGRSGEADGAAGGALKYSDDGTRLLSCDSNAVAVTVRKGVRLIHGNAFRGCRALLRLHFLGDAPNAAEETFSDLPRGCTIYMEEGAQGWTNDVSCVWNGIVVRTADEAKNVPMDADGRIKVGEIGYLVRACGDGVELLADSKSAPTSQVVKITVPEKIGNAFVRILGDAVFPACTNFAQVVIPASVTNFGLSAFSSSGRPGRIEIAKGNPAYRSEGGVVYAVGSNCVLMAGADTSKVTIPAEVPTVGPEAFKGCELLTSVKFPPTLKAIGQSAFAGCVGLPAVTVPDTAELAADAFEGCCATINKVGTYRHYDGFAGKGSQVRWLPDDRTLLAEGPFADPLPLPEAVAGAAKGDGFAFYSLAIHCAKGDGVKQDPARAMAYLRQAVDAKDGGAEFLLGLILESHMAGSDLNDPEAPGIAGRFGASAPAKTPFERYVGVTPAAFSDAKAGVPSVTGSLAKEQDFKLVCDVYGTAVRNGCRAAGARLEHLSYLSMLEFDRVEKEVNRRLIDALQGK